MRNAKIIRETKETKITATLELDGTGKSDIKTGCGFLDHMLDLFTLHGSFDISIKCASDTEVDFHHTVEDIGIVLGRAFSNALGDRAGINRYGFFALPMDEVLMLSAVDLSGRSVLVYDAQISAPKIGDFDSELVEEFFDSFTREIGGALHLRKLSGTNSHHIAEACFKSVARSLKTAVAVDEKAAGKIPSTKGTLK